MPTSSVTPKIITGLIGLVLVFILFLMTYYTVDAAERGVLTRFGVVLSVEDPGLHFKTPFVNTVTFYPTDRQSVVSKQAANTYTIDNQEVDVNFRLLYQIDPKDVAFVHTYARGYESQLEAMVIDRLKVEMGKVNVQHVAEKRGQLRDVIKNVIAADAKALLGVTVLDFQLTNLEYTKSFRQAVERAATAKAEVETREQELQQAIKQAETARAKAKGEADALLFNREAEAKGIELRGKAEAAAIEAQAKALASNAQLVELRKAEKWDGALPTHLYAQGPVPFMSVSDGKLPVAR